MYVDAGCLTVLDYDFMVENGADFKKYDNDLKTWRIIEVGENPSIEYSVNGWNGKINGYKTINSGGKLYIGDSCYAFSNYNKWSEFLDKTNFLEDFKDKGIHIDTGGDGDFPLQLIIDGKKFLFK